MSADLRGRLADRAAREGFELDSWLASSFLSYLEILLHWNRKVNLTSLSDPDEVIDRLLLEPLAAASILPHGACLADLGSGGGSPAIPLALALGASHLLMVESRSRKAAFLREAAREVGLNATVEAARFEDVVTRPVYSTSFEVVSIRAVRPDSSTLESAATLLRPSGLVALFRGADGPEMPDFLPSILAWRETRPLLPSTRSRLSVLFHVEQS